MKKILTVLGARPQFVKSAMFSKALEGNTSLNEIIVHTGQHYDENMSDVFFRELGIPEPNINLGISELNHGAMTGRMLEELESVMIAESPDLLLVYGDTNSTLAASLAASKLHIKIAHIESGLRSYNKLMPEEKNRLITDHLSDFLFCPTENAIDNLRKEGLTDGVHLVGDIMLDLSIFANEIISSQNEDIENKHSEEYVLLTLHRPENTDNKIRLEEIFKALNKISNDIEIIMPIHPRTKKIIDSKSKWLDGIKIIDPQPYLSFTKLQRAAKAIFTDSGGLQKEAFFNSVPCITLRDETEWTETVDLGWNDIVGADCTAIIKAWENIDHKNRVHNASPYGDGDTAKKIVNIISKA